MQNTVRSQPATLLGWFLAFPAYLAVIGGVFVLGFFPRVLIRLFGRGLGFARRRMFRRECALATETLERAFGHQRQASQREAILHASYRVWGQIVLATHLPEVHQGNFINRVSLGSLSELYLARERGRGMVAVCSLAGHWELFCRVLGFLNFQCTIVLDPSGNPWLDRARRRRLMRQGAHAIRMSSQEEALLGDLRGRGIVCFVQAIDHRVQPWIDLDFLGDTLTLQSLPLKLAKEAEASLFVGNTLLLPGGQYLLKLGPIQHLQSRAEPDEELTLLGEQIASELERQVSFLPDHWPWMRHASIRTERNLPQ